MEQGYHIAVAKCVALLPFAHKYNILMKAIAVDNSQCASHRLRSAHYSEEQGENALMLQKDWKSTFPPRNLRFLAWHVPNVANTRVFGQM